jgi:hypothetical protein
MKNGVGTKIAIAGMGIALVYILFFLIPNQQKEFALKLDALQQDASSTAKTAEQSLAESQKLANTSQGNTYASVIKQWGKKVAQIACNYIDSNGNIYQTSYGSASAVSNSTDSKNIRHGILTNLHVITDNGISSSDCYVQFPDDPQSLHFSNGSTVLLSSDYIDATILEITNPTPYINSLPIGDEKNKCQKEPELGDEIVVLGYPGIGADRSITATEGIISGFENNYYVTSAKVEHGNSGGLAILVKDNCILGIPTFTKSGTVESLARILKWEAISLLR